MDFFATIFSNKYLSTLLPIGLGTSVGYLTRPDRGSVERDYRRLQRPPLSPPAAVFGPVWTTLYGLMGFAAYRAWTTAHASLDMSRRDVAVQGGVLYTTQLALNLAWMPLYFGFNKPRLALADIVLLWGNIATLSYVWSDVDVTASYLMLPYLAWVSFATYLNAATIYLNKDGLAKLD